MKSTSEGEETQHDITYSTKNTIRTAQASPTLMTTHVNAKKGISPVSSSRHQPVAPKYKRKEAPRYKRKESCRSIYNHWQNTQKRHRSFSRN